MTKRYDSETYCLLSLILLKVKNQVSGKLTGGQKFSTTHDILESEWYCRTFSVDSMY